MTTNDIAAIAGVVLAYAGPLVAIFVRMESRFTKLEAAMGIGNGATPLPQRIQNLELRLVHLHAVCPYCEGTEDDEG